MFFKFGEARVKSDENFVLETVKCRNPNARCKFGRLRQRECFRLADRSWGRAKTVSQRAQERMCHLKEFRMGS